MSTPISINCSGARAGIPEAVVTVTNVCVFFWGFFCPTTIYTHACMYTILHTVLEHDALGAESIPWIQPDKWSGRGCGNHIKVTLLGFKVRFCPHNLAILTLTCIRCPFPPLSAVFRPCSSPYFFLARFKPCKWENTSIVECTYKYSHDFSGFPLSNSISWSLRQTTREDLAWGTIYLASSD